jgi:hypothetical protein
MRSWRQWVEERQDRTFIYIRKSTFHGDMMDHDGVMAGGMMAGREMGVGAMGEGMRIMFYSL